MKKSVTSLTLLLLPFLVFNQIEKTASSKIERVTVFLKGAQITRTTNVDLKAGTTTLVFKELSSELNPSTIQVKSSGDFIVLSVNHRRNYGDTLTQPAELEALQNELLSIQDSVNYLKAVQQIASEEEAFLKKGRPNNIQESEFSFESYQNTATFYAERIKTIRLQQVHIDRQIRSLKKTFQQKRKEIVEIMGQEKDHPSEILVKVKAKKTMRANMSFSYLTPNASWTPTYDLKVETVAQPINLVYKANVVQATGEDWEAVLLTFSNADPSKSGVVPSLPTNYLNYGNRYARTSVNRQQIATLSNGNRKINAKIVDEDGTALIGASVFMRGTSVGTITDIDGNFELNIPEGAENIVVSYTGYESKTIPLNSLTNNGLIKLEEGTMLSEVVVVGYGSSSNRGYSRSKKEAKPKAYNPPTTVKRKQTTVEFAMDIPYTIQSNKEEYSIILEEGTMEAIYEYQCVPKLEEAAYLNAKIANWTQYNLMSGAINLYFENTYIGRSELDTRMPSDTLEISLGRDQNVQVQRSPITELKKRSFIGNKQEDSRAYRIEVRNNKSQPINIQISDQIPVSKNKDISVDRVNVSNGKLNEETGKVVWTLNLKAGEEQAKVIAYSVKYPKNRYVVVD